MKKLISQEKSHDNDIELPLVDKTETENLKVKAKSHFLDFLNSESPSSKYIKNMPFLKLVTFFDTWLFARKANAKKGSLESEDLPLPFSFYNVEQKILALDYEWTKETSKTKPSIISAILRTYKKECLLILILGFFYVNARLITSLLMGGIIKNVTQSNFGEPLEKDDMLFAATLLGILTIIAIFLDTWYWHLAATTAVRIRNTIIGFAYKKLQSVALSSIQEINIGKVINLLSNDINDIDKGLMYVTPVILSPYTIGISGFLLWNFFGFITIFGIIGLVAFLALSNFLSNKTESIRIEKNAFTDERIKLTNELIECIRLIKMYAWEKAFKNMIESLREKEVVKVIKLKILDALGSSFSFASSQICLLIMSIIDALTGGVLSPQKIYTTLMILNFIRVWGIFFFHSGVMFIANSRVMKKRIEDVLSIKDVIGLEETIRKTSLSDRNKRDANPNSQFVQSKDRVIFDNFSAWWKKDDPKPCLENINITLYPGQITTVIGSIGSGKTSFLLSFLREIPSIKGRLLFKGKVAYVEQEPIIFSGNVRSNILFGLDFDEELYKNVVKACNLKEDFKQFDDGDLTLVGERGITLSGGQKARVSLARALYSKSDIYLFDDPLSAVDSKVGRHIFDHAIKSEFLSDKIVVLVTHHLTYAKKSDRVLLFSEGKIIGDGTFESLKSLDSNLLTIFKEIEEEKVVNNQRTSSMMKGMSEYEAKAEEEGKKVVDGDKEEIKVTWKTYLTYALQAKNNLLILLIIGLYVGSACSLIGFVGMVGYWGEAQSTFDHERSLIQNLETDDENENQEFDHMPYILGAFGITLLIIFTEVFKTVYAFKFVLKANSNMHQKMLQRLTRATVLFYDTTPIGTILNRFSNDIGVLDGSNVPILNDVVDGSIFLIYAILTLVLISYTLIIPSMIVLFILYKIKKFFEKPVMETKRLDLSSRSPLYSEISSTVNGLLAIRVYQQGGNFIRKFCDLLYNNCRAFLYMERTMRFFAFTMNVTLDSLTVIGTFIFIFVAYYTNLQAGLFGLALVMLQEIAGYGAWIIRMSLLLDINMQSVERVLKYYELPVEPPTQIPEEENQLRSDSKEQWPQSGQIEFNNVYMKYRPEFDYVLKGVSFKILGGCKVGVVGRTGAGKSSILQVLFRMVELDKIPGSHIKIDGVDVSKIGLELLRKSLAIIPQTPVIFTGKIRRNLDPFDEYKEFELWQALEEVNLKSYVQSLENKLDTDMTVSSSVFSAGQKQLVCLARAILRKSKILVLDEATANVDIETDDFIQKKIMEKFRDCTVITIAHRLITIANYDKVLVMQQGRVLEYDSPYLLLVKTVGDKYISQNEGIFAEMVKKSGETVSKKIFEVAAAKYFQDRKK